MLERGGDESNPVLSSVKYKVFLQAAYMRFCPC